MQQRETHFMLPRECHEAALTSVKALADRLPKHHPSRIWHYAFVETEQFLTAKTLQGALRAWRWKTRTSPEDGSIVHIKFAGEKLGDEDMLFAALAPYVEAGSYIEMEGEDGAFWRWVFHGSNAYRLTGRLLFEEPSDANRIRPERLRVSGWRKRPDTGQGD